MHLWHRMTYYVTPQGFPVTPGQIFWCVALESMHTFLDRFLVMSHEIILPWNSFYQFLKMSFLYMYMKIIPKFKRWFSNKIVRIRLGFWFYISREVTRTYPGIVGHWLRCNINEVRIQSTLRCAMRGSRIFFQGGWRPTYIYVCWGLWSQPYFR